VPSLATQLSRVSHFMWEAGEQTIISEEDQSNVEMFEITSFFHSPQAAL